MNLLSLLGLSVIVAVGIGHGPKGLAKAPPPGPVASTGSFWKNHPGSLGPDDMPSAAGMSAYWKTPFTEQRSQVTLYEPSGVGVSLPSDSFSVVNSSKAPPQVPPTVELERVAFPIVNPLAGVTTGISVVNGSIGINAKVAQRTISGDTVWIENVHVHAEGTKDLTQVPNGLSDYVSMAIANGSDFYRMVIVQRPLASGDAVAAAVFLSPKGSPRSVVSLLNSLPG